MAIQTDKTINIIRGKALVSKADDKDIAKLFEHIDALEMFLENNDVDDVFGTEGWRHAIGLE